MPFRERFMKVTDAEPNDNKNRTGLGRMRMEMVNTRDWRGEAWGGAGPGQLEL